MAKKKNASRHTQRKARGGAKVVEVVQLSGGGVNLLLEDGSLVIHVPKKPPMDV